MISIIQDIITENDTLFVALIAAATALLIARLNADYARVNDTLAAVRKAYVDWFNSIDSLVKSLAEENLAEMHGQVIVNKHDIIESDHSYDMLAADVFAKAAAIHILDPVADVRIHNITSSIIYREWHKELPKQIKGQSVPECALTLAADVLRHTSIRLMSKTPYKRRRKG